MSVANSYNPFDGITITPSKDSEGFNIFTISRTKKVSVRSGDGGLKFEGKFTISDNIPDHHDMSELHRAILKINKEAADISESTQSYVIDYKF